MKKVIVPHLIVILALLSIILIPGYIYTVAIPRARSAQDSNNPLRKSIEEIREYLLEFTPTGMSMDDVTEVIIKQEWGIRLIDHGSGYVVSRWGTPGNIGDTIIGEMSMVVTIGYYLDFFETAVSAYYGFDENSNLIDIAVRKDTDAP